MVKKVKQEVKTKGPEDVPKVKDLKEEDLEEEESLTVKQKKENAKQMTKAIKKFNAKLKKSLDRKLIIKAV